MKRLSLLCLTMLVLATGAFAQIPLIQWQKSYGGSNWDELAQMDKTTDGGYILAGQSFSNDSEVSGNHGSCDFWVAKISGAGDLVWQRSLGGLLEDRAMCVQATSDGGYIVGGSSFSNDGDVSGHHGPDTTSDAWVTKLAADGLIIWQRSYGGASTDQVNAIIQTSDGGYAFIGQSKSVDGDVTGNHGGFDYWVGKLTATGILEWQRSYGGSSDEQGFAIQQTPDGGYIVTGECASGDGDVVGHHGAVGTGDMWVLKLTATGAISWQHCLGGPSADFGLGIKCTYDGSYIIAGNSAANGGDVTGVHGVGAGDYWLVKVSATGSLVWQKAFGGTSTDKATAVWQTPDSGYVVGGYTVSNNGDVTGNHGTADYWLVKVDDTGGLQWQKTYGGTGGDFAYSLLLKEDGGYVMGGVSRSNNGDVSGNHGDYDYWVLSLSPSNIITGPTSVCEDANITLTDTSTGGTWSVTNPHATITTGGVVTGSSAGIDTVKYTIGSGAGASVATYPITINPLPVVGAVTGPSIVCTGSSVSMSDTSVTGNWTMTNPHAIISIFGVVNGVSPGIDTVFYTVTNACGSTSQPFVITVNASVIAGVAFSISPSDTVCAGTPVTLTAISYNGGLTPHFYWQLLGITVDSGATHVYVPTDGDVLSCCMATSMVCASPALAHSTTDTMHVIPLVTPTVHIISTPVDSVAYSGQLITFHSTVTNGGTAPTYQWILNGVPISGATDSVYAVNVFGNDTVYCIITSSVPCADTTAAVSNGLNIYNTFVGITDPSLKSNIFSLYPNPNNGSFTLNGMSLGNIEPITLEVTNMLGQVMWTKKVPYKQGMIVDLHGKLVPGNYLFKVKQEAYQQILHLVISAN